MTEIIKDRSMIDDKYKWDLTKVYKTNADFESDCKKVKNLITEYRRKYENHTMDNAKIFYDSIVDELEIERLLEKLYSYSNLKKDEDVANTENQELRSKVVNLYEIEKTGKANIVRNVEKSTLTLITCKQNTNKQIVYICELIDVREE